MVSKVIAGDLGEDGTSTASLAVGNQNEASFTTSVEDQGKISHDYDCLEAHHELQNLKHYETFPRLPGYTNVHYDQVKDVELRNNTEKTGNATRGNGNERHRKPMKTSRRFPCPHCDLILTTRPNRRKHVMIHTGERPFVCETCGVGKITRSELKRHMITHTRQNEHYCGLCVAPRYGVADSIYDDCSLPPLCAQRSPDHLDTVYDPHYIPREPCRCDDDCHLYGDCCPDAPDHIYSNLERNLLREAPGGHPWACQPLLPPTVDPSLLKVSMINWCPDGTSLLLDEKCRKDTVSGSFNYTYLIDVPVISSNSGIIYQNIFCGKCHREYYFIKYDYSLSCDCEIDSTASMMSMNYHPNNLTWTGPRPKDIRCFDAETVTCFLIIDYPENLGRVCEDRVIEYCQEGAVGLYKNVETNCLNGSVYYMQDINGNVYKNSYCSFCNGVSLPETKCLQPYEIISSSSVQRNDLWTISDLFDFDRDCDLNYFVSDPVFGQCDLIENFPDYIAENDTAIGIFHNETTNGGSTSPSPESIVSTVLMSLSIVCLFLHIIIFLLLYEDRKLHSLNLFSMTCALCVAEIFFVFGANLCRTYSVCYFLSIMVYYFFMAAFLWMNVISSDICKTFNSNGLRTHALKSFTKYSLYAWGIPALMVLCAMTVDTVAGQSTVAPAFAEHGFWFGTLGGLLLFFVIPVELLFLVNTIMFIISANEIRKQKRVGKIASMSSSKVKPKKGSAHVANEKEERKIYRLITGKVKKTIYDHEEDIKKLKLDACLALLMGIPWIFAVLENVSVVFEYLFSIVISLQGAFIFLAFDCKKAVWRALKAKITGRPIEDFSSSSGRQTHSTSSTKTNSNSIGGTRRTKDKRGESNVSKSTVDTNISLISENTAREASLISHKRESFESNKHRSHCEDRERLGMNSGRSSSSGSHHGTTESRQTTPLAPLSSDETLQMKAYYEEDSDLENEAVDLLGKSTDLTPVQEVEEQKCSSESSENDHQEGQQSQLPALPPAQTHRKRKKKKRREYADHTARYGGRCNRNDSLRKAISSNSSDEDVVDV
ncbi:GPCR family 2 secretin-like [Trinorchestia longiramus]|nr:GPCR family 2 secretin-like [Trinorchestia longiramus]